jgi:crotonobetainyl-CoA:carnitine CoA-transferase CaiB-like acyl-CoA transferase
MHALDGITVLDLSHALAGPYASTMLGDVGAEVIKIEAPDGGDMARTWGPPFYGTDSAYFVMLNRNKKSVTLDLKHPLGRDLLWRLLERADVLLENLRIGAVQKLGLDYEQARLRNPGIVYCSISGFGQDGPYRDRAALDLVVQAESGMISVTGPPDGPGVRCGISIADITAGLYAAFGIVSALHSRAKTGRGQFIDVSMLDGQLALLHGSIGSYLADGRVPQPMGTAYGALLPYQTFRTRTRDLALGVGSDKLWRAFCGAMGLPELSDDARYATNAARVANRASLIPALQAVFLTDTYEAWEAILLAAGIPIGAVNTIEEVIHHPQVRSRGALVEVEHPEAGTVTVVGPPLRFSETPASVRTPAPRLGEHTDDVLREQLGLGDDEIDGLRRAGALG